ncbi:UDP-N-acetylmuramate--L-alanine ligase [Hyphococcus lacteus]|uniref:Mur ligase family protein n=1 Tax=Hyphococcus lacteus TaxID=3143536 RepID=A0ABV3Z111_9PROT
MSETKDYFFCGIGGSGMLPLAMIVNARGAHVEGSDRALDQGRSNAKFDYLRDLGIALHPQDGSGVVRANQILVASAAVEDTVPDIVAANKRGASRLSRAALLAKLFNESRRPIGVAGTSGKSTTTGMIGWILHHAGASPTVMNGAVMKNFVTEEALFASALVGDGDAFISEVDESDGSIAMFSPKIAVLNNISLDHKTMDELRTLFGGFINRAELAVLNLDNDETARLAASHDGGKLTYSLTDSSVDLLASKIEPQRFGVSFTVIHSGGDSADVTLKMPGRHNVSNALAAIAAALACGVSLTDAAEALGTFEGVRRRLEYVGTENEVTIIDDFGHNPDKISASLNTLHEFSGRLLVMFQPHGFGPLKKMKAEFVQTFIDHLEPDDILVMPQPAYFGGTVDRSVTSDDIALGVREGGRNAVALADREACRTYLESEVRSGDRIVIMGARDDTLSDFAQSILKWLSKK